MTYDHDPIGEIERAVHMHPELGGRSGDPGRATDEQRRLIDMPLAELKLIADQERQTKPQHYTFVVLPVLEMRYNTDCRTAGCVRHHEHEGDHQTREESEAALAEVYR